MSTKVFNKLNTAFYKLSNNPKVLLGKFYNWLLNNPFYTIDEFMSIKEILLN